MNGHGEGVASSMASLVSEAPIGITSCWVSKIVSAPSRGKAGTAGGSLSFHILAKWFSCSGVNTASKTSTTCSSLPFWGGGGGGGSPVQSCRDLYGRCRPPFLWVLVEREHPGSEWSYFWEGSQGVSFEGLDLFPVDDLFGVWLECVLTWEAECISSRVVADAEFWPS